MTIQKIKGIITAISGPREHDGKLQIGFVVKEKWYNVEGTKEGLEEIKKISLIKGNEVEFEIIDGTPKNLKVIKKVQKETPTKWEDEIVSFETLLTAAHKLGKFSIKTKMIQLDLEKKFALFKCRVIVGDNVYEGHGDATNENVTGDFIKPHFIRMAETRAICRALRWYTNNGVANEEKD